MSFIVSTLHLPAFHNIITVGPVATREHFTISGAQGLNIAAFSTVQYSTVQYQVRTQHPHQGYLLAAMCCFQEQFKHLGLMVLLNGLFAKLLLR